MGSTVTITLSSGYQEMTKSASGSLNGSYDDGLQHFYVLCENEFDNEFNITTRKDRAVGNFEFAKKGSYIHNHTL